MPLQAAVSDAMLIYACHFSGTLRTTTPMAIKEYDMPRGKLVILTKCYGTVGEDPGLWATLFPKEISVSKDYVNQRGELFQSSFIVSCVGD